MTRPIAHAMRVRRWGAAFGPVVVLMALTVSAGSPRVATAANASTAGDAVVWRWGSDTVTAAMRARGDSIFHGQLAGGMCLTCHGQNAKGMPGLGPDLTDAKWLHGDGSMTFLTTIIKTGVMKPKQSAAIMPPGGGAPLTPEQVTAVAGYVYSLTHKGDP